ncbi:GPI transamidase component, variant 2 [Entomophthora muscae]|uniref:GPI transamidase component, variant 2 n=1 Tax=Entomophthora muscae TaxID=34485 RepID=A0ACC2TRI9_9FUNG|nr:GPI transamidase component, variant 2 [Entomophthora muscae]
MNILPDQFFTSFVLSPWQQDIEKLLKNTVNKILIFFNKESLEDMAVDYSPSYQLTFTVMYETPPSVIPHALGAGLPQLISEQFSPFLTSLSPLSNFEVTSQAQFYSGLAFKPKKMAGYEGLPPWHAIEQRQLPHFINSAEWDLASAVSNSPDLNLIIYVPSPHLTPLHIVDTKGRQIKSNAFAIPQWGGVVIVNPSQGQISVQDIKEALSVHLLHLQELLGLVQAPFDPPQSGLRLSLDRLFLQKTTALMLSATKTLSALQALIITITQMEVGDIIVAYTKASLNALSVASNALALGNLMDALQSSRLAFQNAESGFFHPTMVSQMYFPTDASYALFLPLLLPAILPLTLGFFKSKRRSMATKASN